MDSSTASTAGQLAVAISGLTLLVQQLTALSQAGAVFSGQASIYDATNGNQMLQFPQMTVAESAAMFQGAITAFQARLTAATAQLAGM
jgi:hypothetical protein